MEFVACFSCLGVESYEEFVGERDADDLGRFAGPCEPLPEGDEVWFVAARTAGGEEQEFAHSGPAAGDGAPPLLSSTVLSQGSEACLVCAAELSLATVRSCGTGLRSRG